MKKIIKGFISPIILLGSIFYIMISIQTNIMLETEVQRFNPDDIVVVKVDNSDSITLPDQDHSSIEDSNDLIKKQAQSLESINKKSDSEKYQYAVNDAKKWWVDELGYDIWKNWTPPIIWQADLSKESKYSDTETVKHITLGQTYTYVDEFPLKDNYGIAYIQIDNKEIEKGNFDLTKVLIHELGHSLGLQHEESGTIMEPLNENMRYKLTNDQKAEIRNRYELGH